MAQNFPHPIPTGWFPIAASGEIGAGHAVQRSPHSGAKSSSGDPRAEPAPPPYVTDAFCPASRAPISGMADASTATRSGVPSTGGPSTATGACRAIPYAKRDPARCRSRLPGRRSSATARSGPGTRRTTARRTTRSPSSPRSLGIPTGRRSIAAELDDRDADPGDGRERRRRCPLPDGPRRDRRARLRDLRSTARARVAVQRAPIRTSPRGRHEHHHGDERRPGLQLHALHGSDRNDEPELRAPDRRALDGADGRLPAAREASAGARPAPARSSRTSRSRSAKTSRSGRTRSTDRAPCSATGTARSRSTAVGASSSTRAA